MSQIFEPLLEQGRRVRALSGYGPARMAAVLRMAQDGRYLGIDIIDKKKPREVLAPKAPAVATPWANTGVHNAIYGLGLSDLAHVDDLDYATDRHDAFLAVLGMSDALGFQVLRRFTDRDDRPFLLFVGKAEGAEIEKLTEAARKLGYTGEPVLVPVEPSAPLLFEIEGMPDWHLDPKLVKLHQQRLGKHNSKGEPDQEARCSLCDEIGPIARTWPKSKVGALVSFNDLSLCAHGKTQSYVAQTCVDCAEAVTLGIETVATVASRYCGASIILWWRDGAEPGGLWPLFNVVMDPCEPEATRRAAISQIAAAGETTLVCMQKNMARIAVKRAYRVNGADVAHRLESWLAEMGSFGFAFPSDTQRAQAAIAKKIKAALPRVFFLADDLCAAGVDYTKEKLERARNVESIIRLLIAGEPLGATRTHEIQLWIDEDLLGMRVHPEVHKRRRALLNFHERMTLMPQPQSNYPAVTAEMRCGQFLARALCRVDFARTARGAQRPYLLDLSHISNDPQGMFERIERGNKRRAGGGWATIPKVDAHAAAAFAEVGGVLPITFDWQTQTAMYGAFLDERAIVFAEIAAYKAQKATAEAAQAAVGASATSSAGIEALIGDDTSVAAK